MRVCVRDEKEVESARRRSVRRRASKKRDLFGKAKRRASGKKYLHDGARRFGPRRARRGVATRSATRRSRPTLLARIVAGWTKGGGRTFRGGGERSSAFPVRRAGCDWRQPSCARSGAHRATPRLRAFQRPRRRGRPRRGRGRASERVSKRHRHEIAPANRAGRAMITLPGCGAVLQEETFHAFFVFAVRERCSGGKRVRICRGGRKIERILRMGIHIAYYRTIACMGRRLTLPGLSATRRAVAARRELPDSPAAPHFTGGEPAAPGERIPAEPARSVEGSERHRGRLEAHWAPESSFSRLAPGRVAASGRVPPLHAFAPRAGDGRGKPGPGTMPTDRVDEPQVVPWLEKDDLAYYGPFRCVSRPAPRDGTTHVPHSTRRPLPRFSRAKLALAKDSIP